MPTTDDAPPMESPWALGQRVRVARPDNPDHPRRGAVGTVARVRWFEPTSRYVMGEPMPTGPGVWLVRVTFDKASWADWRERGGISDEWGFFGHELAHEDRR